MSDSKRKPLLSDDECYTFAMESIGPRDAAEMVRDHYEHLITEGKLRVMEEVDNFMSPYPIAKEVFGCSNCQTVFDRHTKHSKHGRIRVIKFCPGCGNKIKR